MKKINILFALALVAFMGIMTSCGEDDPVGPTLSFFSGAASEFIVADKTVEPGATLEFSFSATKGDANIVSLNVSKDGTDMTGYPSTDVEKDNYVDTITITADMNEGIYVYIISVEDKDGETASKTFNITVEATSTGTAVSAVTPSGALGAQAHETLGSYITLTTGNVMTQTPASAASASVDMICYFGTSATFNSPSDLDGQSITSGLTTKNATKLSATNLTAADFDAITDTYDFSSLTISGSSVAATAGSVFAFETVGGKKGLVKVITAHAATDGSATISIIVED